MIYWYVVIAFLLVSIFHPKSVNPIIQKYFFLFSYIFIVLFIGLRYASVDYFSYQLIYDSTFIKDIGFPFFESRSGTTGMEFLWALATSALKLIDFPFEAWVFLVATLSISIKFIYFSKNSQHLLLAIFLYVCFWMVKDMGQIRNGLAGGFALLSMGSIIKGNKTRFFLWSLIASSLQIFSLILFPLYFICWLARKKLSYYLIIFAVFFIISINGGIKSLILSLNFIPDILMAKAVSYAERGDIRLPTAFSITGTIYLIIFILSLWFWYTKHKENRALFVYSICLSYGLMMSYAMTGIYTAQSRALDLMAIPSFIMLLLTCYGLISKKYKPLSLAFIWIVSVTYFSRLELGFYSYDTIL